MNSVWRDAWWLSRFELFKMTGPFKLVICTLGYFVFLIGLSNGSENMATKILFDFVFVVAITTLPYSLRSKEYQLTRVSGDFWGCHSFNFLQEQPISEDVLLKSRFLSNFVLSVVTNLILVSIFLITPSKLSSTLSIGESIIFLFLWLLIGLMVSFLLSASDVGDVISMTKMIIFSTIIYGSILAMTVAYYFYIRISLVEGSIFLIKNYPIVTLVLATLFTIGSYLYWYRYSVKKVRTIDYL
ncbi:hypothetical protein [Bacillus sp. REN10]|uniref:hypothetical protein n=1 Tax=Bacillus sp. REN10 TaxID=2782541 RepID=UPI00193B5B33|nr:hypothetical protein [Bacillus sp. REN10]